MLLAIVTCPHHYHITQLCARKAIEHLPDISQLAFIYDDQTGIFPDNPLHIAVRDRPAVTFNFSNIDLKHSSKLGGWYRQQLIKLHLDKLLKDDEFIIIDGDVILNEDINPHKFWYGHRVEKTHHRYDLLDSALGFDQWIHESCQIMHVKASWLKGIRRSCLINHGSEITELYYDASKTAWSSSGNWLLSEWELIYRFATDVAGAYKPHRHWVSTMARPQEIISDYDEQRNWVLDGKDNLGLDFFDKHGIKLDKNIYSKLEYGENTYENKD